MSLIRPVWIFLSSNGSMCRRIELCQSGMLDSFLKLTSFFFRCVLVLPEPQTCSSIASLPLQIHPIHARLDKLVEIKDQPFSFSSGTSEWPMCLSRSPWFILSGSISPRISIDSNLLRRQLNVSIRPHVPIPSVLAPILDRQFLPLSIISFLPFQSSRLWLLCHSSQWMQ